MGWLKDFVRDVLYEDVPAPTGRPGAAMGAASAQDSSGNTAQHAPTPPPPAEPADVTPHGLNPARMFEEAFQPLVIADANDPRGWSIRRASATRAWRLVQAEAPAEVAQLREIIAATGAQEQPPSERARSAIAQGVRVVAAHAIEGFLAGAGNGQATAAALPEREGPLSDARFVAELGVMAACLHLHDARSTDIDGHAAALNATRCGGLSSAGRAAVDDLDRAYTDIRHRDREQSSAFLIMLSRRLERPLPIIEVLRRRMAMSLSERTLPSDRRAPPDMAVVFDELVGRSGRMASGAAGKLGDRQHRPPEASDALAAAPMLSRLARWNHDLLASGILDPGGRRVTQVRDATRVAAPLMERQIIPALVGAIERPFLVDSAGAGDTKPDPDEAVAAASTLASLARLPNDCGYRTAVVDAIGRVSDGLDYDSKRLTRAAEESGLGADDRTRLGLLVRVRNALVPGDGDVLRRRVETAARARAVAEPRTVETR